MIAAAAGIAVVRMTAARPAGVRRGAAGAHCGDRRDARSAYAVRRRSPTDRARAGLAEAFAEQRERFNALYAAETGVSARRVSVLSRSGPEGHHAISPRLARITPGGCGGL